MLNILLAGKDPEALADFAAELSLREEIKLIRVASGREARAYLENLKVDVVVTDEVFADGAALPFVHELIKEYPLINCAMVSGLGQKGFHEATEGLGIFMQLPVDPGAEEAVKMLLLLESIDALMGM
ncbi:MAG: hypothetical protein WBB19_03560 [Desulforhopalus sp.]